MLVALALILALSGLGVWGARHLSASRGHSAVLTHVVRRDIFVHDITESGSVESARNVDIISKVRSMSGSGVAILEIVPEGTVIRAEDCIPEDAVVPLEVIKQLEEYHRAYGIRLADYGTERDPRQRTDLPRTPGAEGTAQAGEPVALKSGPATEVTVSAKRPQFGGSDQSSVGSLAARNAGSPDTSNGNGSAPTPPSLPRPSGSQPRTSPTSGGLAPVDVAVQGVELSKLPLRERDLREILPDLPPLGAGKRLLTFEEVRDKMVLVRLDSASLENQRVQQQITCENSRASVIQALSNYEAALIALQEYLEGTYRQQVQDLLYQELMAEENLARAQQYYEYSRELYAKGYISERELQANEFDVQKKKVELETIKTKRRVLDKYTKEKVLTQLQADIESARAKLEAARRNHLLDLQKLQEIEEQISNCTIFATRPGQVVYANERDYRGGTTVVIEPGTVIRERQVIIRLPDPTQMRVVARVNESRVNLVQRGMRAKILLDAFLNYEINGVVEEVSDYPAPTSFWLQNVKEYEAKVRIENPPPGLRPGFTAQVRIRVAEVPNVLQVPVQCVLEHGGKHYCLVVKSPGQLEPREVRLGLTNDKVVIIEEGLEEGEVVVLNAREFREKVNLPKLPGLSLGESTESGASGEGAEAPRGAATERERGEGSPAAAPGISQGSADRNLAPGGRREAPAEEGQRTHTGLEAGRRPPTGGQRPGGDPAQFFARLDRNGDGKIDRDEAPEFLRSAFETLDSNRDGGIDLGEFQAAARQFFGRRAGVEGAPGSQGGGPRPDAAP